MCGDEAKDRMCKKGQAIVDTKVPATFSSALGNRKSAHRVRTHV